MQLLGNIDMDTREWNDGVLTYAARQVVKEPIGDLMTIDIIDNISIENYLQEIGYDINSYTSCLNANNDVSAWS